MKTAFVKMHGLGNDFAVFDGRQKRLDFSGEKIAALADRRTGIGFDQMVVIDPPRTLGTEAFLRIYNADGGEVGACGNATRCIIKFLNKEDVKLETKSNILICSKAGNAFQVDMGKALLEWKDIPLSHSENTLSLPISEGRFQNPVAVNVGNPHAVFFVPAVNKVMIEEIGIKIENHSIFPQKTNVEFAEVLTRSRIRMRVWERGVGVTKACGTGACAVAVAGVRRGLTERRVTVVLDGGNLDIEWRENDGHVLMTGPAEEVYRGEIEL